MCFGLSEHFFKQGWLLWPEAVPHLNSESTGGETLKAFFLLFQIDFFAILPSTPWWKRELWIYSFMCEFWHGGGGSSRADASGCKRCQFAADFNAGQQARAKVLESRNKNSFFRTATRSGFSELMLEWLKFVKKEMEPLGLNHSWLCVVTVSHSPLSELVRSRHDP